MLATFAVLPFSLGNTNNELSLIVSLKILAGYRDRRLISVAREAGRLDDLRAILCNDAEIKAFRSGTFAYPGGATIGRLGALIVFILAPGFFITPTLMGGPSDLVIATLIEREIELSQNWPSAAIMALILLAITLAMIRATIYYALSRLAIMIVGVVMLAPILVVIVASFSGGG
jgi:hypothetical protein